jgi:hypothetical protein
MKLVSTLLATALVAGTAGIAMAQSGANPTQSGAQPDKTISSATHCMDQATKQPRLRSQTTGGNVAAGNATAGDKSARSTGTSSQSPASPSSGQAMNLPNC